jgi:thiol-disulfide isomerase/thioredoxin
MQQENNSKKKLMFFSILIIVLIISLYVAVKSNTSPGKYDNFVDCLNEKGAKLYGAFWCPHCQAQKAMFGKSSKKLNYIECSTPDGQSALDVCKEAGIEGYPTWKFNDGMTLEGEVPLETLSQKTSCNLQ